MPGHDAPPHLRAVLLGGAYGSLALARSLTAAGFQVCLVRHETRCVSFSNAVWKVLRWAGPGDPAACQALEDIARANGLSGSLLVPGADPEVAFMARAHGRLASTFRVLLPDWSQLQWSCDKALACRQARAAGVAVPHTYEREDLEDPLAARVRFPLVLKPALRADDNAFTRARAWRVDDATALARSYRAACELMGVSQVLGQDLIPGDGQMQFSYAGLWDRGRPVVAMTARRLRQHPAEFGSTSTYVLSASLPEVRAAAETFLRSVEHHGLVEVEFKRDPRDGVLKLLDVNPRPWNWLGLAGASGVDLGAALLSMANGEPARVHHAQAGVAWTFVPRDLASAARAGRFHPHQLRSYLASWRPVRKLACFSWSDPIPGLVDLPSAVARATLRRLQRVVRPTHA